jgi:hypothetical protein
MKLKKLHLFICLFAFAGLTQAQEIPKSESSIDVSLGFGSGLFSAAGSWNKLHGVFASDKFRIGYGVRASYLRGSDLPYTTAPANLAKEISKVDTLTTASATTIGLNAVINLQYKITSKIALGFNIDAIGVGLGSTTTGTFQSSDNKNNAFSKTQEASPTSLNVLLVGNNDIGQLKSEFYLEYLASSKLGIRAGTDLTFSELTTKRKLTQDNDRFRYKAGLIFLGISYKL